MESSLGGFEKTITSYSKWCWSFVLKLSMLNIFVRLHQNNPFLFNLKRLAGAHNFSCSGLTKYTKGTIGATKELLPKNFWWKKPKILSFFVMFLICSKYVKHVSSNYKISLLKYVSKSSKKYSTTFSKILKWKNVTKGRVEFQ